MKNDSLHTSSSLDKDNLFTQLIREKQIPVIEDNQDVYMEAVFSEAIPYMKTTPKVFNLSKGNPNGKGNICFLYGNSTNDTLDYLMNGTNAIAGNRYYFYYFPYIYRGKVRNKPYREKLLDERKEIYEKIEKHKYLHPYTKMNIAPTENRNMFYDLSHYIEIFNRLMTKGTPIIKVEQYWIYLKSILDRLNTLTGYKYRFILFDINKYNFDAPVAKNLSNPLIMVYYTLFKYPELLKGFDYDFIFFTDKKVLKFNPTKSVIDKNFYREFRVQMNRLVSSVALEKMATDAEVVKSDATETAVANIASVPEPQSEPEEKDSSKPVESNVDKIVRQKAEKVEKEISDMTQGADVNPSELTEVIQTRTENEINSDPELLMQIYRETVKKTAPSSPVMSARDAELKKKQEDLVVHGMTIADIKKIQADKVPIPSHDVSKSVRTTNKNMKHIRFQNFEKAYNENVMTQDITNAILALNGKSIPMYVRDIKVVDTSDELNYKETWTIYLEDANRQRHTVKVDIPKFYEDKFLYLGGNKKIIKKQNFLYPVVKTGPDTVQIVTNYNKMFIRRVDTKSVSSVERLKRMMKDTELMQKYFTYGMMRGNNVDFITTIEYDELSKIFIRFKSPDCTIFFNQKEAAEYRAKNNIALPAQTLFIGVEKGKPIYVNTETQLTITGEHTIIDLILRNVNEEFRKKFEGVHPPKRLMYTRVKVMEQFVAVIMLIGYWEGFSKVLDKMGLEFELRDKPPATLSPSQNFIKFADCYFVYNETMGQSLILNGLRLIDTSIIKISEMDTAEPYIRYFTKVYGKASIANALNNFYEFIMDPITIEVCKDINLPTDIVSLVIYATNMLADSQFTPEIDQHLSRIRSNEIVPAILYEALARNYITYRNSGGKKKYSVPQDIVIKNLVGLKTVEDYSTLNPTLEMEMEHSISSKGFRGANLDESYTLAKRAYHKSMTGIISPGASPDGTVGVNKTLSCEPMIKSVRGYVDIKDDVNELKDVNLFSPGELLIPLAATRDDSTRLGHAIKQSKHVIPVRDSAPVLISNGMEEVCRFKLSSDFVVNADEDGEVVEYDEQSKIMIVKYKSGKCRAINLGEFIVKNGGGGFFLSNQLITKLKVGDKFKKDDVLAYHKDFFTNDKFNDCRMNMGTMAKVALMSTYNTYEDATAISQRLADAASTELCFQIQAVIGMNANVLFMTQKGKTVNVGDPLIQFDTSYEDNELNALLASIGESDIKKQIEEEARNTIKSKYSGVVEEIEVYSTVPLEQLSPSLRKLVSGYYRKINHKKQLLEKYDPESKGSIVKCGMMLKEPTHEIEPNKYGVVRGQKVEDAVLINFYIKHAEPLEVGSKIANFTKPKCGEVKPF